MAITGVSAAWRPELAGMLLDGARSGSVAFTEIVAENVDPAALPAELVELARLGVTVVPHGVTLGIAGADVRLLQVILVVSAFVLMVCLDRLVQKTKLGRSVRAVAEDAPTAALMGINIDKTISRTFVIGGALGAMLRRRRAT